MSSKKTNDELSDFNAVIDPNFRSTWFEPLGNRNAGPVLTFASFIL